MSGKLRKSVTEADPTLQDCSKWTAGPDRRTARLSPPSRSVAAVAEHLNDYGVPHHPDRFQDVLNQSWPPSGVAGAQKNRPDSIDVQVRIEFETDGEQWVDAVARRWWQRHVCVECDDPRLQVRYIWVDAGDVRRR